MSISSIYVKYVVVCSENLTLHAACAVLFTSTAK